MMPRYENIFHYDGLLSNGTIDTTWIKLIQREDEIFTFLDDNPILDYGDYDDFLDDIESEFDGLDCNYLHHLIIRNNMQIKHKGHVYTDCPTEPLN